jgi:3,4-dihydroxy 2-butanone 4-phosphate synthase/GTP cyclohydrolase II
VHSPLEPSESSTSRSLSIDEALRALRQGSPVLIAGGKRDPDEGPALHFLAIAADRVTPERLKHFARLSGGLLYVCLTPDRAEALGLRRARPRNERSWQHRVLESFDAVDSKGSGIGMIDRARTIALAVDPEARPADVRHPGHMLALEASRDGTLERLGYTEAAVDLARMAGSPAAVISEVLDPNGEIADEARLDELIARDRIPVVDVADIARRRAQEESIFRIVVDTSLPTAYGTFKAVALRTPADDLPYLALVSGNPHAGPPLLSVHRRCMLSALWSRECDCRSRVDRALKAIAHRGGILLQLPHSPPHDVGATNADAPVGELSDAEIAALVLRALGVNRVRAVLPGPLTQGEPVLGLEIVESVALEDRA